MCFSGFSNSHRDCGGGVAIFVTVAFGLSDPLGVSKMSAVAGIVRVGVAILVTVIPFGPSDPLGVSKDVQSVKSHRDRGGWGHDPCNNHRFWTLGSSWNAYTHSDRGGWVRNPGNCERA